MATDRRAAKVWKRFLESYGAKWSEAYGPKPLDLWTESIDDLTDGQISYGIRKVIRDTPIFPPTLGQFVQACNDMPVPKVESGPSLQEQLVAYVVLKHPNMPRRQMAAPWTYLYREWVDGSKPKHLQRCAECSGVLIPAADSAEGFREMVIDMMGDQELHPRVLKSFKPGNYPRKKGESDAHIRS